MKRIFLIMALAVVTALAFSSCDNTKDKPANPSSVQVSAGLKTALMKQGFKFDTNGALVVDSKVKNTKELDLSGSMLKDFKGLSAFPNLKSLVLRNNGYYPSFDFSSLPQNIDAVDLRDNKIFIYNGLVSTKVEDNGDETTTILHKFKKLYLPNGAKDNLSSILSFYLKNKDAVDKGTIDMQMQKKDGSLEKYTTIREVPDAALRKYLKDKFSDIFVGDKIDISKRLSAVQSKQNFSPSDESYFASHDGSYKIEDFDGAQYVINNRSYKATMMFIMTSADKAKIPYIKIPKECSFLMLGYGDASNSYLDFSEANGLSACAMTQVTGLKTLDLSNTGIGIKPTFLTSYSILQVLALTDLEELKLPKDMSNMGIFILLNSPKLKALDISSADSLQTLSLAVFPPNIDIKLPKLYKPLSLGVTKDVYNIPSVHKWIFANVEHIERDGIDADKAKDALLQDYNFSWSEAYEKETKTGSTSRGFNIFNKKPPFNSEYTYNGEVYNINMNGNTGYPNREMYCNVGNEEGYSPVINGTLPKIGSMPGNITLDFAIKKDSNGNFKLDTSYHNGVVAVLKILNFISVNIYPDGSPDQALSNTHFDKNNLTFRLKCHGNYLFGDFKADVSFRTK